jgi:hypothetical protein
MLVMRAPAAPGTVFDVRKILDIGRDSDSRTGARLFYVGRPRPLKGTRIDRAKALCIALDGVPGRDKLGLEVVS